MVVFYNQADWWLVKIDSNGNKQWDKSYDGKGWDDPRGIVQTSDSGYAMFGSTASGTLSADMKMWLIKTDNSGNLLWSKTYGGTGTEQAGWSLVYTDDGGFAFVGRTTSFGAGGNDFWFVKTDSSGVLQFNQTYGGVGDDICTSLTRTNDGGYAVVGYTNSYGTGSYDCLLIKFAPLYTTTITHIGSGIVSPNDGQYIVNSLTLTVTPASNYAFMCWLQNGTFLSSSNPYSYTPTNSYVITAIFYDPIPKDTPTPAPTLRPN